MLKKIIVMALVFAATSLFGMSLSALNSASKAELMEINGIGEMKANAIIKERRKGKFKSFDDLTRVEGIGEQTAANVKNDVKSAKDVKKVSKKTKTKAKKKTSTQEMKEKTEKKAKKTKSKAKKDTKDKAEKKTKKRKIKSMDEKKKELKTKAKKKKTKKTKAKKEKKTKSKN